MTYEEARAFLAAEYGWDFATIDEMSFEQITSALLRGRRPKGIPVESPQQAEEVARNWRAYYGI